MVRRRGFSMMEVVLAVVLFGVCGVALLSALTHGAAGAARAGEAQLGGVMAARVLDRVLAAGYSGLLTQAGRSGPLTLTSPDGRDAEALDSDGVSYSAEMQVDALKTGLLRVVVHLAWKRAGSIGASGDGELTVMRYVADPALALAAR